MTEHRVSAAEISAIAALGFKIDSAGTLADEDFVNLYFTGFNLLLFLEETERLLKPIAEDTIVKTIIIRDDVPPKLLYYIIP